MAGTHLRPMMHSRPARSSHTAAAVLGIRADADVSEIKAAFRSAALRHHPDHGGCSEHFLKVQAAYRELMDAQVNGAENYGFSASEREYAYSTREERTEEDDSWFDRLHREAYQQEEKEQKRREACPDEEDTEAETIAWHSLMKLLAGMFAARIAILCLFKFVPTEPELRRQAEDRQKAAPKAFEWEGEVSSAASSEPACDDWGEITAA
eukprot:4262478-Pleurochrysis_carterae.AAC.3